MVGKFGIPFVHRDGGIWWPVNWLEGVMKNQPDGLANKSIGSILKGAGGFTISGPGADFAILDRENRLIAAANYPSTYGCETTKEFVYGQDKLWWHETFGGAIQEPFQPLGIISFMLRNLPDGTKYRIGAIVPVVDYMFYRATGEKVHDKSMLQSMGVFHPKARREIEALLNLTVGVLCPWVVADDDYVCEVDGVYCGPSTHDSPPARIGAALVAPRGFWSGSWFGVYRDLDGLNVSPDRATCNLGLSFEGHPTMLTTNTGKFGTAYEGLYRKSGFETYEEASEYAASKSGLPIFKQKGVDGYSMAEAAAYVTGVLNGTEDTPEMGLATVLHNAFYWGMRDLKKLAKVDGTPAKGSEAGIVGGWSENAGLQKLFEQAGVTLVKPPHARHATEFVHAALLIGRIIGCYDTRAILEMMSGNELNS